MHFIIYQSFVQSYFPMHKKYTNKTNSEKYIVEPKNKINVIRFFQN